MADLTVAVAIVGKDQASGPIAAVQKALSGLEGAVASPIKAVGALTSALGGIGLAAGGIQALAGAAQGLGSALGTGLASQMENARAQLLAFTKSGEQADSILKQIRSEADKTPFSFQAMATATASLLPASKQANVGLMDLIKQAEVLAALNPGEGLTGAAFSLKEALSGDFVSIVERFNLPRQYINQLKAEGVPAMEIVSRALQTMGADMSLVTNLAGTTSGRLSTFQDAIDGLRTAAGNPILAAFGEELDEASGFIERNKESLTGLATALGGLVSSGIERAGDAMQGAMRVFEYAAGVWGGLHGDTEALTWGMQGLADALGDDLASGVAAALSAIRGDFTPAMDIARGAVAEVQEAMSAFAPTGERLGELFGWIGDRIQETLPHAQNIISGVQRLTEESGGATGAVERLADVVNSVSGAMAGAIQMFQDGHPAMTALVTAVSGAAFAFGLLRAGQLAAAAASGIQAAALGIQTAATWLATGAQTALNVALTANPIGLVATALAGLAAGLIYAYNTNETFREGVQTAWAAIRAAAGAMKDVTVSKIGEIAAFIRSLPERFRADAVGAGLAIVQGLIQGMNPANVIKAATELGRAALSAARAALDSRSPSREFEEIGEDVVEGLALGIEGSAERATAAIEALATSLGATFEKTFTVIEQAQNAIDNAMDEATRGHHRKQEIEETKHLRRLADLEAELGAAKGDARKKVQERIEKEREDYRRRTEDGERAHQDRLVELEFDAADKLAAAERKQAEERGKAMRSFQVAFDALVRETDDKARAIGEKAGHAAREAIEAASRGIQDARDRASTVIQNAVEGLGLSRLLRGRRDEFSTGQDEAARAFKERREDAELVHRRDQDLAKARTKFDKDLREAKDDDERRKLQQSYDRERDSIRDRFEEAKKDLARRRQLEQEERTFRQQQETQRRAFEDGLENEAHTRTLNRIIDERETRIREINAALVEKQTRIEEQERKERETLKAGFEQKAQDLRDNLVAKIGPLLGEQQTALSAFLDGVATKVLETAGKVTAQAAAAAAAIAAIGSSAGSPQETIKSVVSTIAQLAPTGALSASPGGTSTKSTSGSQAAAALLNAGTMASVAQRGTYTRLESYRIGSYDVGGIVPGPVGSPRLAIVHAGEEIRTPAQQRGAIDYDRLAAALSRQPIVVQISGETVARVVRSDNRRLTVNSAGLTDGVGGL